MLEIFGQKFSQSQILHLERLGLTSISRSRPHSSQHQPAHVCNFSCSYWQLSNTGTFQIILWFADITCALGKIHIVNIPYTNGQSWLINYWCLGHYKLKWCMITFSGLKAKWVRRSKAKDSLWVSSYQSKSLLKQDQFWSKKNATATSECVEKANHWEGKL